MSLGVEATYENGVLKFDELPKAAPDEFELGILEMIAAEPPAALEQAQRMVPLLRASNKPRPFQPMLLEFIERVILHQFPKMSREEMASMLQITDVRQSRIFQEAQEEGREEGREEGIENVALRLLQMKKPIAEIVAATGLTPARIRKLKKQSGDH